MRIVINIVSLSLNEGALIRERNIIHCLGQIDRDNEYVIIGQDEKSHLFSDLPPNFQYISVSFFNRTIWECLKLPKILKKLKADIVYSPHHKSVFFSSCKKIIAVRNIAPFDSDVVKNGTLYQKFRLIMLRFGTRISVYNSDYVIFMSKALKDIVSQYGITSSKSSVIYHGIPSGFEPKSELPSEITMDLKLPNKYILLVSHLYRYKNVLGLVKAFADIKDSIPFSLVVAGKLADKKYYNEIIKYIEAHNIEDHVKFMGFIEHDFLPYLYSNCTFFVFPSTCENAPITLIEAVACGAPIACSNVSGMPETCGEAALYFNPYDVSEIASAILKMSENRELREQLSKKSLKRARKFSWQKAARQTHEIFERVYNQEKR